MNPLSILNKSPKKRKKAVEIEKIKFPLKLRLRFTHKCGMEMRVLSIEYTRGNEKGFGVRSLEDRVK